MDLLDDEDFTEDIDSATIEGEEDDETDPTVEQKRNVSTEVGLSSFMRLIIT